MDGAMIDARTDAALARLTDNEKECLRRRLDQQTAKELALELGVSPHTVEKRLKMARTKLGLSSSLEAARLLAVSEGYQLAGPRPTDLASLAPSSNRRLTHPRVLGVALMLALSAAVLILAMQPAPEARGTINTEVYAEPAPGKRIERGIEELEFVPASPERVEAYVRGMFDQWDRDGSGYVEQGEAPERLQTMRPGSPRGYNPANVAETLEGEAAQAQYIANVDKDGDRRVGFEEFATPVRPQYLERGIPLIPADWAPGTRRTAD